MSLGDDIGSLYRAIENFSVPHGATSQDLLNRAQALMEIDKRIESLRGQIVPGTEGSRQYELMRQQCGNAKNKLIAEVYHARSTASSMDKQLMDTALSKLVMGAPRQGGQKRKAEKNNDEVGVGKQKHGLSRPLVIHQDVRNLVMSIEAALQDPTIDLPRCESMLREIEICRQSMAERQGDTINLDQLQAAHNAVISARDEQLSNQVGRLVGRIFEPDEGPEDDMNLREASAEVARFEHQLQPVKGIKEIVEVAQRAKDVVVAECGMVVEYLRTGVQQFIGILSEAIDSMEISVEKDAVQTQVDNKLAHRVDEEVRKRGKVNFRFANGWTPLMVAAVYGSAEQVQKLLDKGADVNYPSAQGETPLLVAAGDGTIDTVRILLGRGAEDRGLAIGRAIVAGRVDIVRLLIEKGVDPNFIRKDSTLLALAARCGKVEIVRYLLSAGADVNFCTSDKYSALMEAASSGNVNVLKALLEAGANVDARNKDGWTALIFAAGKGYKDIVEALLKARASVDARDEQGRTALMGAASKGHRDIVEALLKAGANVDIRNVGQETALMMAVKKGHKDIVELLSARAGGVHSKDSVEKNVVQAQVDNELARIDDVLKEVQKRGNANFRLANGWTPLMVTVVYGSAEQIQKLLDSGADVNYPNEQGQTPLMVAAEHGTIGTVRILLGRGAGDRGLAIGRAIIAGKVDIVRLLIEDGVDPNFIRKDSTLLAFAARHGKLEVVRYLLSAGANVNFCTSDKHSALMEAASLGNVNVLKVLLEAGANVDAQDGEGWTALMLAEENGHRDIVELLRTRARSVHSRDSVEKDAVQTQVDNELARKVDDALEEVRKRGEVNFRLENGLTPLMTTAAYGSAEQVQKLVNAGADVNYSSEKGTTPIMSAARYGTIDTVRVLLRNGAKASGLAVMQAIEAGNVDIIRLLIEEGVDPNFISEESTLLALAARYGRVEVVRYLLEAGADVNLCTSDEYSALMEAVRSDNISGNIHVVRALVDAGANVDAQNSLGGTSLMFAVLEGRKDIVEVLLNAEANVEARAVVGAIKAGNVDLVRLFIEHGVSPNFINEDLTLLTLAVRHSKLEVVRYLLRVGADVNLCGSNKYSALMEAANLGNVNVLKALLEAGAKVDAESDTGWTAIMCAVFKGHKDVVDVLLKLRPIDVNFRNKNGDTPLVVAAVSGQVEVVELLMRAGADPNIMDASGRSPLIIARLVAPRDKYEKIKALLSVDPEFATEYKKIYKMALVVVNASSMPAKKFTYKDIHGGKRSIVVDGLVKGSNYFSRVMEKNWRKYTEEHRGFLPETTVKRVESALELNQRSLHIPVEEIVERYLDGNPVIVSSGFIMSSGFSGHCVNVVLSDGFVLLANRGAESRATTLEVFRFVDGKDKDPEFLKEYISHFHQLSGSSQDDYKAFIEKEFSSLHYRQQGREVERVMEEMLSLPQQTVDNCPWANLEQALIGLVGLESVRGKVAGNEVPSVRDIKKILLEDAEKFKEFTGYQVSVAFEKFQELSLQGKFRESTRKIT